MKAIISFGIWLYTYATDFCINASNLLGIDYVTFGSIFFGAIMNGVILILILLNKIFRTKKKSAKHQDLLSFDT